MKKFKTRITSLLTAVFFIFTQLGIPSKGWAASPLEVKIPSPGFQLSLPPELGTIQTVVSGQGPTVIHIQTAHGNYEAQKKIESILHYLKNTYGFKLLLLEGTGFKLNPELLHFFPKRMDLTKEVAEDLAKKALIKGSELFLLEAKDVQAYGIENREAYVSNGKAFVEVITQKEKTEKFLQDMDLQIGRLSSPYLAPNLRSFLKQLERFENKTFPFLEWLTYLKTQAKEHLEVDLANPSYQLDWPMLFRVFKLREFESKLDMAAFQKEKLEFLKTISRIPKETYQEIEKLLSSPLSQHQLPDPETGLLFDQMVSSLPESFRYEDYPNVTLFIGHLIIQSELKGERLIKEMDLLSDQIADNLADSPEAKQVLTLLKDHRLLKKLFVLELTPEDYERILSRQEEIRPDFILKRFLSVNKTERVKNVELSHTDEINSFFEKALEFYKGVKARDRFMLENIEGRLKEMPENKAIIVTGGFHAEPFKDYFQKQGYNYALIAPKITTAEGRESYIEAALQNTPTHFLKATRETVYPYSLFLRQGRREGVNPLLAADRIVETELRVAEKAGELTNLDELAKGSASENLGLSYRSPVKGPGGKEGLVITVDLSRLTGAKIYRGVQEIFLPFGEKKIKGLTLAPGGIQRRIIHSPVLEPVGKGSRRSEVRGREQGNRVRLSLEELEDRTLPSSLLTPILSPALDENPYEQVIMRPPSASSTPFTQEGLIEKIRTELTELLEGVALDSGEVVYDSPSYTPGVTTPRLYFYQTGIHPVTGANLPKTGVFLAIENVTTGKVIYHWIGSGESYHKDTSTIHAISPDGNHAFISAASADGKKYYFLAATRDAGQELKVVELPGDGAYGYVSSAEFLDDNLLKISRPRSLPNGSISVFYLDITTMQVSEKLPSEKSKAQTLGHTKVVVTGQSDQIKAPQPVVTEKAPSGPSLASSVVDLLLSQRSPPGTARTPYQDAVDAFFSLPYVSQGSPAYFNTNGFRITQSFLTASRSGSADVRPLIEIPRIKIPSVINQEAVTIEYFYERNDGQARHRVILRFQRNGLIIPLYEEDGTQRPRPLQIELDGTQLKIRNPEALKEEPIIIDLEKRLSGEFSERSETFESLTPVFLAALALRSREDSKKKSSKPGISRSEVRKDITEATKDDVQQMLEEAFQDALGGKELGRKQKNKFPSYVQRIFTKIKGYKKGDRTSLTVEELRKTVGGILSNPTVTSAFMIRVTQNFEFGKAKTTPLTVEQELALTPEMLGREIDDRIIKPLISDSQLDPGMSPYIQDIQDLMRLPKKFDLRGVHVIETEVDKEGQPAALNFNPDLYKAFLKGMKSNPDVGIFVMAALVKEAGIVRFTRENPNVSKVFYESLKRIFEYERTVPDPSKVQISEDSNIYRLIRHYVSAWVHVEYASLQHQVAYMKAKDFIKESTFRDLAKHPDPALRKYFSGKIGYEKFLLATEKEKKLTFLTGYYQAYGSLSRARQVILGVLARIEHLIDEREKAAGTPTLQFTVAGLPREYGERTIKFMDFLMNPNFYAAPIENLPTVTRSELRINQWIEEKITVAVRKNFEGPMNRTLFRRFEIFGRAFQETALKTLGVEPAFAQTALSATVDFARIEQEISSLGALKSYFPLPTESQPTSPRALYDYRGVFSETPKDYDLLLLQAASDRNLKLTVWLNATEEELNILRTKLSQYAQSRYGFYPQNLKIEVAPQNVIGELFARARKGKLPTGFVSSDRTILPQVNAGRGIILAIGSSQTTVQNLTATLLAERLLNFSPDQLDPRIYTGEYLAEGRWAELFAFLEARQAMLAAA